MTAETERPCPAKSAQFSTGVDIVVITRMRHQPATGAYVTRRLAKGKTKSEIIRVLKRYVAREIYKQLPRPAA